jgi:putative heme-binding domain-containing protein
MERGVGAVIRISLPTELPEDGGIKLTPKRYDGNHDIGNLATAPKVKPSTSPGRAALFAKIDAAPLPEAYKKMPHQKYVDTRLAAFPKHKRDLAGTLFHEFRQSHPDRYNDGQFYVKIIDYLIKNDTLVERRFIKKWQHHNFGAQPNNLAGRSIEHGKVIFEQATCSRCHSIEGKGAKLGPDLTGISKKYQGSKLLEQVVRPSTQIHKEFQPQLIVVDTGQVLTGVIIKESPEQITLLPNMLKPEKTYVFDKSSIDERQASTVSSMPIGLLDTYTVNEILDLIAYIQSVPPKPEPEGSEQ